MDCVVGMFSQPALLIQPTHLCVYSASFSAIFLYFQVDCTVKFIHLLDQEKRIVHVSLIRPYRNSDIGNSIQLKKIAEFANNFLHLSAQSEILDLRMAILRFFYCESAFCLLAKLRKSLWTCIKTFPAKSGIFSRRKRSNSLEQMLSTQLQCSLPWSDFCKFLPHSARVQYILGGMADYIYISEVSRCLLPYLQYTVTSKTAL